MGILLKTSAEVKSWISDQPRVKEESITDWMLWNIDRKCDYIKYFEFTRGEESNSGADWVWCFHVGRFYFLFLVQAKKLKTEAFENHKALNYRNANGRQIEILRNYANDHRMLAVYTFYTNLRSTTECCSPKQKEGVFLSSADKLLRLDNEYSTLHQTTTVAGILGLSIGLSCLEGCPRFTRDDDPVRGFESFIEACFQDGEQQINNRFMEDNLPEYIRSLVVLPTNCFRIEKKQRVYLSEEYEEKFKGDIENIQGLLYIDLNDIID